MDIQRSPDDMPARYQIQVRGTLDPRWSVWFDQLTISHDAEGNTLLAGPVDSDLRTLPPDAALLAFYLLPDGTAVADFSETLATSTPSGILSEQLAVDSITRTLEANVPQVKRLKILIHGQEVDTLAGHVDLTQLFIVSTKLAQSGGITATLPIRAAVPSVSPAATPSKATPATPAQR